MSDSTREASFKCDGCGLDRDKRTALTFRPDGLGDIFTLCSVCVESIGLTWTVRQKATEMERAIEARLSEADEPRKRSIAAIAADPYRTDEEDAELGPMTDGRMP